MAFERHVILAASLHIPILVIPILVDMNRLPRRFAAACLKDAVEKFVDDGLGGVAGPSRTLHVEAANAFEADHTF